MTNVAQAPWVEIPSFTTPSFHLPAILFILPVAIAPAIEHIGDVLAISSVTKNNYLRDPGIHRTLLGDGIATTLYQVAFKGVTFKMKMERLGDRATGRISQSKIPNYPI